MSCYSKKEINSKYLMLKKIIFISCILCFTSVHAISALRIDSQTLSTTDSGEFEARRHTLKKHLKALQKPLVEAEQRGEEITCANQIYYEAKWALLSIIELDTAENRINDLASELAKSPSERLRDEQSPIDGSWGRCYNEWFFKVVISGDHIIELNDQHLTPQYSPKFLDRINSPEKLIEYLQNLIIVSDERLEKPQRRELNESSAALVRLINQNIPSNYSYHPELKSTLLNFINNHWQDPETGYWGMWIKNENQSYNKTKDLSLTFHMVSYLNGQVKFLDKIFETTYLIKDNPYPNGWLQDEQYDNHNNYNIVRLFMYGWNYVPDEQKNSVKAEIQKMLTWCLSESFQSEGYFKLGIVADSQEDEFYYGVSFLDEIGFFNKQKRFWTNEEFNNSESIRQKLIQYANQMQNSPGGKAGLYYQKALKKLGEPIQLHM